MPFEIGGPTFGLQDVKVAAYTATNTYSSEVDIMSVQALNTVMRVVTAELTGDDKITATASRPVGAQITMRMGGVSLSALEVMIGNTATSSIASPNNVKNWRVNGGESLPYFGLTGRSLGAEDPTEDTLVFLPKCKIMSDFNLIQLEYGQFAVPEITIMAVADASYGIVNIVQRESGSTTVEVPPANIPVNS